MGSRSLSSLERDALREVASIGAGHAATALSQMTGSRIMINVPEVALLEVDRLGDLIGPPPTRVAAVMMRVMGDFTGTTVVAADAGAAHALCDMLLHRPPPAGGSEFDPMEQSTLKETGNILCSAYLNALSDFLGLMLLPSVPDLVVDTAAAALSPSLLRVTSSHSPAFCVETAFRIEGSERAQTAQFLLLPDPAALDVIFDAIQIAS
jgi:chemotaxis protein CheC